MEEGIGAEPVLMKVDEVRRGLSLFLNLLKRRWESRVSKQGLYLFMM